MEPDNANATDDTPVIDAPRDFDPSTLAAAFSGEAPGVAAPRDFDPSTLVSAFGGDTVTAEPGVDPQNALPQDPVGYAAWSEAQRALFMLLMIVIVAVLIALAFAAGDGRAEPQPLGCDDGTGLFDDASCDR